VSCLSRPLAPSEARLDVLRRPSGCLTHQRASTAPSWRSKGIGPLTLIFATPGTPIRWHSEPHYGIDTTPLLFNTYKGITHLHPTIKGRSTKALALRSGSLLIFSPQRLSPRAFTAPGDQRPGASQNVVLVLESQWCQSNEPISDPSYNVLAAS
jgi:hypothetical protein